MRRLTKKERIIMDHFWRQGPLFIRDLLNSSPDPRPSFNTLASQVRTLELDGFLKRDLLGNAYRYSPNISEQEYGRKTISGTIEDFFNNSYLDVIHSLVKEERISLEELKGLVERIEKGE
ncbi:MAG: BlaI/MecI/CopY family transcriptional regulator [Bacteroidales bacterium]|nr:BlaI/MecI/CopY family transcriptional regulator [Bacteroidales bacterium]